MTLRPPAAAPFAVIPAAPPPSSSPASPRVPAKGTGRAIGVALGALGVIVAVCVLLRMVGRSAATREVHDAAPTIVRLGTAPSASVNLAPAELPQP